VDYVIGQANDGVIVQDSVVAMMIADARRRQPQAKKSVSPDSPLKNAPAGFLGARSRPKTIGASSWRRKSPASPTN
jgi:hypothetical protein